MSSKPSGGALREARAVRTGGMSGLVVKGRRSQVLRKREQEQLLWLYKRSSLKYTAMTLPVLVVSKKKRSITSRLRRE